MGLFDGLFGGGDSGYDEAQEYLEQIKPMLEQYYNPYIQQGNTAGGVLENQFQNLLNNPASVQQMLGSGYQQSPGYQYQYDQALNAANNAAAAGGYAGNNAHMTQAASTAGNIANQDYWKYYNANENLFNQGLGGYNNLFNTGFNATNNMVSGLGNLYGSQANLAYANNQTQDQMLSSLLGAGIGAAGYALGGPMGGAAASGISSLFNKGGGGSSQTPAGWMPSLGYAQIGSV